ncbi:MAG TPA: DUF1553 domain-containing protein, partial [Bryobacteraceae bacterium]|nr:DUF1553 domain-containing protein [Bryobacteraceae bacterium]
GMRIETANPIQARETQHIVVTYDGSMKASGVRVWVNGEPQRLNVLFDSLLWPINHKEPWRIGAGGGVRFKGAIDDVRVYDRALADDEVAALTDRESLDAIARKPGGKRSKGNLAKLRLAFLERYSPTSVQRARAELTERTRERDQFLATVPTLMVMREREIPRETFLLNRGAYDSPGDRVSPAVPAVLPQMAGLPRNRLGLARWLVDPGNPLTARATVNRLWAMIFGTGIVKTIEDLGSQGEWPVHPELLDWLAVDFIENGWKVKQLLKTMVMSATYRQSSRITPDLLQRDPENRLLARGARFRLAPEMIRDQVLAVSGLLVDQVGGPPVRPYQPAGLWQELQGGQGYKEDSGEGLWRRSLYTYWRRTVAPPNMITFDSPTRETCVVRENRTNTPLQALNLMNDVAYVEAARKLAERVAGLDQSSDDNRIARAFTLVLGREPLTIERDAVRPALAHFRKYYREHPSEADKFVSHGKSPISISIARPELAAWTAIASLLFNTDEAITKE